MTSIGAMGFFKRAIPFFAALIIGIFIASFFVDLTRPRFNAVRSRGWHKHREMQRLRAEAEELRNEKLRLQNEIEALKAERRTLYDKNGNLIELNIDEAAPAPPMPLRHPREIRIEKYQVK